MIHLGTRAGTECGKPVARRWWVEWPPAPRFFQVGPLVAREEPDRESIMRGATCGKCLSAVKEAKR